MNLVRDTDNPALWTNEDWEVGSPGTFVLVIGVSAYQHLDVSKESFGLGSLYSSSLTAHYVFQWLKQQYRGPDLSPNYPRPLAKLWYLVAPTPAEIDIEPELGISPIEPTRENCEAAVGAWDAALRSLSVESAGKSTSIFFYSGHGFEVHSQEQILLPSDYLSPPTRNVNKGISTRHLHIGMSDLKLNEQLFFVDACRNDVDDLRKKNPRGETILNQPGPDSVNSERISALFHATASGQQAFQPRDPSDGPSIFGKALLEGLRGRPDIQLIGEEDTCTVNLLALNAFLKKRVPELLSERAAQVAQPVWLSMENVADFPISVVSRQKATAALRRGLSLKDTLAAAAERAMSKIMGDTLSKSISEEDFDHPVANTIWKAAEFYDFESRQWLPAVQIAPLPQVRADPYGQVLRIEFRPDFNCKYLLRINSDDASYAFTLPGDLQESPTYRLDLALQRGISDSDFRIDQAVLELAPWGMDGVSYAAHLWETFRDHDLSRAAALLDMDLLEELLRDKLQSPLGASVAGMVLLRTGALWRMHDWARNLAKWFPSWSEGPVLWAHQLVQQNGEVRNYRGAKTKFDVEGTDDPLDWIIELEQRGLPSLSELVSAAIEVTEGQLPRFENLDVERRDSLQNVQEKLNHTLRYFRPGSLFSSFHARDSRDLAPELVMW